MRTIMIIGGKLQGLEAAYLAMKAGMYTIVVDKDPDVPARGVCSEFICTDVFDREPSWLTAVVKADLLLPAMEDRIVLSWLIKWAGQMNIKVAFDMKSFELTRSKQLCDEMFLEHNIPAPAYYPRCSPPYVVKPSEGSGSDGVRIFDTEEEVEEFLAKAHTDEKYVVQEFVSGQGYSIEVIGKPGQYRIYETTTINIDDGYDCCEVLAPSGLAQSAENMFSQIAVQIAEQIGLHGIMDVEAIEEDGIWKVLEIDARIPSQTPIAVYHSIGINMVEELFTLFCDEAEWENRASEPMPEKARYACYECIRLENGRMRHEGEHIIAATKGVKLYSDLHGADEVMIDTPEGNQWSGIFINAADSEAELAEKRSKMVKVLETQNG